MLPLIKNIGKAIFPLSVQTRLKVLRAQLGSSYSFLEEEKLILKYLDILPLHNKYCVDIAASDGISMSNTYSLFKKGWEGLAVEVDGERFAQLSDLYRPFQNVNLVKTKVTPDSVISILKACACPVDFSFLSFDIDSYDFFVLDQILSEYRPRLICTEINEKIPPPLRFTVKYREDYAWAGGHFYGQSISRCYELCQKYGYDIVELHYNNLFLVPQEINQQKALSPEDAYKAGYLDKPDRKSKFPWNAELEDLLHLPTEDAVRYVHQKFAKYQGQYLLEV